MPEVERSHRSRATGFSFVEMVAALAILATLAAAAMPLARWTEKRRVEGHLRVHLETMRAAIDRYKQFVDEGLITQSDVEQMGYPRTLEELAEGVEVGDPQAAELKTIKFLGRIPEDPFTGRAEWGLRSYQDDFDSTSWGGENVYDVYSLSEAQALDGTYYRDW